MRVTRLVMLGGLVVSTWVAYAAWSRDPAGSGWWYWLIWPAMVVHQCEELVFTDFVQRRRFAFLAWAASVGFALTPRLALGLNVGLGWTMAIAAGLAGERFVVVPLFVIAVEAVNGFWHLSMTSYQQRWSPGTLTGVLVAIPLAFAIFATSLSHELASPAMCFATFLFAALSHHLFLRSIPRT